MCNPAVIPIVMMAVTAAGKGIQQIQTNQMAGQAAEEAHKHAGFNYQQLISEAEETNDAAAQDKLQRQLQGLRERGRIAVAQGEAGVGGNSSLKAINNAKLQESMDVGVIEANRGSAQRKIASDVTSTKMQLESRINTAKSQVVGLPMMLLTAGMAGTSGYMAGHDLSSALKSNYYKSPGTISTGSSGPKVNPYNTGGV